jgi:coenzyme F420-reducing hydrogenase gamma subunit
LTGYATKADVKKLKKLNAGAVRVVAYGTCPTTGGVFGLANQRGGEVVSVCNELFSDYAIMGCPPNPDDLREGLVKDAVEAIKPLCKTCNRSFQEETFMEITRPYAIESEELCYNNQGHPCSGVVAGVCSQRCVDFNAPCRGCVNLIECPSLGMVSYFGTMARQVEVETVANIWTTDKLGDGPDDLTESMVDVVGTFFRFHLACAFHQSGKLPSNGSVYSNIMVGRPIEEAIQIAATIYGSNGIQVALGLIEAYEKSVGFTPSEELTELRNKLREAQDNWKQLSNPPAYSDYSEVVKEITAFGGNEVLSNLFFTGFRTPVKNSKHPFEAYNAQPFEPTEMEASLEQNNFSLKFSTDDKGILREWSCEF